MSERTYQIEFSTGHIGVFINHPKPRVKKEPLEKKEIPFKKKKAPLRKKPNGFSPSSRIEFRKHLSSLTVEPNFFVTLSCPIARRPNEATVKKYRDNFTRKLKKDFPESWGFWRIEPHKADGRPHFHMLIYVDPANHPGIDGWIRSRWFKTIGAKGDESFRLADVQQIREGDDSLKRVKLYMTKAEVISDWRDWGWLWIKCFPLRWGMFNKANIPQAEKQKVTISQDKYEQIQELIITSLEGELAVLEERNKDTQLMPKRKSYALHLAIGEKRIQIGKVRHSGFLQFLNDPVLSGQIRAILK